MNILKGKMNEQKARGEKLLFSAKEERREPDGKKKEERILAMMMNHNLSLRPILYLEFVIPAIRIISLLSKKRLSVPCNTITRIHICCTNAMAKVVLLAQAKMGWKVRARRGL
jgi:hypothetical protein